jgi:hypothetical protein
MSRIEGQANDKAIAAALAQDTEIPAGRAGQDVYMKTASKGKGKQRETDIWTDRYKPKQFTELLGDEVRARVKRIRSKADRLSLNSEPIDKQCPG